MAKAIASGSATTPTITPAVTSAANWDRLYERRVVTDFGISKALSARRIWEREKMRCVTRRAMAGGRNKLDRGARALGACPGHVNCPLEELPRCPREPGGSNRDGGWRSRLKSPTADPAQRPDLSPKIDPNGVTPGAAELFLISQLTDKVEEPHQAPSLIQTPDLIITPDRDARYRPPAEVTTEVLDRIAQRAALEQALPSTLVVIAHPDDEAIGAGGLLAGLPDAVVAHVTDGAPRDER